MKGSVSQAALNQSSLLRLVTYYSHIFPDLFDEQAARNLFPSPSSNDKNQIEQYEELLRQARHGWESQPKEFDYRAEVEGTIPVELRGTLFRNGPGLLEVYGTPLLHPIDGDGLICSVTFDGDKQAPRFRSKYVKTKEYVLEHETEKALFRGMMGTPAAPDWKETVQAFYDDGPNASKVLSARPYLPKSAAPLVSSTLAKYKNPANTNVFYWGGKLLAVWESGLPYCLDPVTLDTVKQETLGSALKQAKSMAAHFRYDPINDRLVSFSMKLSLSGRMKIIIYEFDRDWNVVVTRTLPQEGNDREEEMMKDFYYAHDMLITDNYYIFHQTPMYNLGDPDLVQGIATGVMSPGKCMRWYPEVSSRMIAVPRDGVSPATGFDTEPCMIYHHVNAWEEGKPGGQGHRLVFSSVCEGKEFNMDFEFGLGLANASIAPGMLWNYVIDLEKGMCVRELADECSCEFPTSHPNINGKKWRYAYLMASDDPVHKVPYQEVVKYDREGRGGRQVWSAKAEGGILGEAVFVPRPGAKEEDDGWVIVQEYRMKEHKTEFVILNAKNIALGPLARVKLTHHVPYGFHGTFCEELV